MGYGSNGTGCFGMALIETNNGLWFQEDRYADVAYGFRVSAMLHREHSAFQEILILATPMLAWRAGNLRRWGAVLLLNRPDSSIGTMVGLHVEL